MLLILFNRPCTDPADPAHTVLALYLHRDLCWVTKELMAEQAYYLQANASNLTQDLDSDLGGYYRYKPVSFKQISNTVHQFSFLLFSC